MKKRSSLSWYKNVYQHKARRHFCAEIWSLKASVGRIAAFACLCKFSAPFKSFVELMFLSFSLTSMMSTGKEQTIDSQHLLRSNSLRSNERKLFTA